MTPCEKDKTGCVAGGVCDECGHANLAHRHGNSKQTVCMLCRLELLIENLQPPGEPGH